MSEKTGGGQTGRRSAASGAAVADDMPVYPGKRFGLPENGPGSAAPMGRRLAALLIDWIACELIVSAILRYPLTAGASNPHYMAAQLWTLAAFAAEVWLLTSVSGLTVGKRVMGVRVIRTGGGRPGFGWALVRTLLLMCVVPPCLGDRDLRGLHDRASDTVVVRI